MPMIRCIRNVGYMHPIKDEELKKEFADVIKQIRKDINGKKYRAFKVYECDCGAVHILNVDKNFWQQ